MGRKITLNLKQAINTNIEKNKRSHTDLLDEYFMQEAIKQARIAYKKGEVPIGAVIEYEGRVFAKAHNQRIKKNSAIAHAEVLAIEKASKKLGDWRLEGMTLYVTVEPCLMCAGAILHSRTKRLVYACSEPKMGAIKSQYNVLNKKNSHHKVLVKAGVLEQESKKILRDFFKDLRKTKKRTKKRRLSV
jgi:tRNA(adenine34) deaminase